MVNYAAFNDRGHIHESNVLILSRQYVHRRRPTPEVFWLLISNDLHG
jgi:hypothetical protein